MDNKMKKIKRRLFSSKKFRYGSSAVIFSAVFVAFVILVNVVLTFVDSKTQGLYVDLTTKQLYSVSEASRNYLSDIDKGVEIIFCQTADKISDDDLLNPVKMLAEKYEQASDKVKVVYKDRISNPGYFKKFYKSSSDVIDNLSVIVYCEATGLSKIYSYTDMYKFSTDEYGNRYVFAFDGENKLTSAILSVARNEENMLKAGFVTGHSENTSHNLQHFLEDYGYEVSNVELRNATREDLGAYDLLVVCDPMSDFIVTTQTENSSAKSVNEVELISKYVLEDMGNVMFFFDPNTNNMQRQNLFELVSDRFGVKVDDTYFVVDAQSLYSQEMDFLGSYYDDENSDGYAVHYGVSSKNADILPAFGLSALLTIPKEQNDNFTISPVITTSKSGAAFLGTSSEISAMPYSPLMTVSTHTKIIDNKAQTARVFVCGSTGFITELSNSSFSNNDLFKSMLVSMGNESILADIDFKVLDETSITVTKDVPRDMTNKLVVVIPVIIAIAGAAVFVKRKCL